MLDNVKDIVDICMADLFRLVQNRSQWRRLVNEEYDG